MTKRLLTFLAAIAAAAFFAAPASASLLGTSVSGSLTFNGGLTNFFDASKGQVPAGCQNSSAVGTTVTVVNPKAEFCFADGANVDTANFTDAILTVTDNVLSGASAWQMVFDFAPGTLLGVSLLNDNFSNGGLLFFFDTDRLTIDFAGTLEAGDFLAQFQVARESPIPEPGSSALLLFGLAMLGCARAAKRRR
jgi:hypothetical protein